MVVVPVWECAFSRESPIFEEVIVNFKLNSILRYCSVIYKESRYENDVKVTCMTFTSTLGNVLVNTSIIDRTWNIVVPKQFNCEKYLGTML